MGGWHLTKNIEKDEKKPEKVIAQKETPPCINFIIIFYLELFFHLPFGFCCLFGLEDVHEIVEKHKTRANLCFNYNSYL